MNLRLARIAAQCFGKREYRSAAAAYRELRKLGRSSVYRCPTCTLWHIGGR